MITEYSTANAVGGRTARACESCLRRRARWYCPADDAFLCQGCDVSVHTANQLARRHERVCVETASFKVNKKRVTNEDCAPAWHHGFTRKARTPRNAKTKQSSTDKSVPMLSPGDHVPEMGSEFDFDNSIEENEEQLMCRVPVFDPFEDELCSGDNNIMINEDAMVNDDFENNVVLEDNVDATCMDDLDVDGFLPSEVDLAEFAADVESLLEKEVVDGVEVKIEDDTDDGVVVIMQSPSPLELTFDVEEEKVIGWGLDCCVDAGTVSIVEEKVVVEAMLPPVVEEDIRNGSEVGNGKSEEIKGKKRKMLLRLNYEAIMEDWASCGSRSPWTTGSRPEHDLNEEWLNCMVPCSSSNIQNQAWVDQMGTGSMRTQGVGDDKGREARVSRYREKRRTRMFSKKIRYQVRKLNAEKRPRMKGRFVKRASLFNGHGCPSLPYLSQ